MLSLGYNWAIQERITHYQNGRIRIPENPLPTKTIKILTIIIQINIFFNLEINQILQQEQNILWKKNG